MSTLTIVRSSCIFVSLFTLVLGDAMGQLNGTIASKPLGVGYMRNITQKRATDFAFELSKRIEIGENFRKIMTGQVNLKQLDPKVEQPINGAAYYMVQGLIPSFETMYFQQVADAADANRVVTARSKMMGPRATITKDGEDRLKLVRTNSWTTKVPKGMTPQEHADKINEQNANRNRGYRMSAKVIEKDGKEQVEQSWNMTEFYRFHDNLLFSANFEELWEANLPSADSLTSSIRSTDDMGLELFFDRIPLGMKQLGWGMINGGAGAEMQQRDGEEQAIADLRRRSIEFGLDLLKAVMFDTDQATGWLRFATEMEQSVRGELNFATRRNSDFAKRLDEVASGNSRFGAILRDDAVGTLHLCIKVLEESDPMLDALGKWIIHQISTATSGNSESTTAASEIALTLNEIGEHQTIEVFLKAGWTEESDGVIYGGIQVDNNPNLLRSLYTLATNIGSVQEGTFELVEKDGHEVIQVNLPESDTNSFARESSLKISHAYVTHQNACLWVAIGGENAYERLRDSIAKCSNTEFATRTPLLTAKVDVERWLELPEDDPVGVGNLLRWMDENEPTFPPSPISIAMARGREQKPTPILERVLELGGEKHAGLTIISDSDGLRLSLNMGEAIANYYVARIVDMQDRMFSQQAKQLDKARAKAEKTKAKLKE